MPTLSDAEFQEIWQRLDEWKASGKPGKKYWPRVAKELGCTSSALRSAARRWRKKSNATPALNKIQRIEEDINHQTITVQSELIHTIDQLIEAAEVDLDVWEIKSSKVQAWPGFGKFEEKDLTYEKGQVTGTIKTGELRTIQLWLVSVQLIRKKPIPLFPTIQPVACNFTPYPFPESSTLDVKTTLIWADPQFGFSRDLTNAKLFPFHNRKVLDVILQIARELQPDRIDMLGDGFDFVNWTDRFLRSPKYEYTTEPAIQEFSWWLRQFRDICPNTEITLHEGNHDIRMRTQIMRHLRQAYGLRPADEMDLPPALSPERLLALHKLGIRWIGHYPNDLDWLNKDVSLSHGDKIRNQPGDSAKAIVLASDHTTITGHAHRGEYASRTIFTMDGIKTIEAWLVACACWIDGRVPGRSDRRQWQNGCLVIHYTDDWYSVSAVPIKENKALFGSKLYEGRDRLDDLRKALPKWNW